MFQLQFWKIILCWQRQKEKKLLKILVWCNCSRHETLQFRIKMHFCYGYTNECQNGTSCHMIPLQGPLSLYCKTVPADFNSETRNPVAVPNPWSGSIGQVYVQFKLLGALLTAKIKYNLTLSHGLMFLLSFVKKQNLNLIQCTQRKVVPVEVIKKHRKSGGMAPHSPSLGIT